MTEPSLPNAFGANASQTQTLLTITKADFPTLTASTNNTAESLIVALALRWEATFTQSSQDSNSDQSIRVERGNENLVTVFNTDGTSNQFKEIPFTITLRKPYTPDPIDPDDY